jgi:uncharacterized protein (DUF488 family)
MSSMFIALAVSPVSRTPGSPVPSGPSGPPDLMRLGTLYTLGYATRADRKRLDALMRDHQRLLVDTRSTPCCSWNPAFRREVLVQRYNCDEQAHLPQGQRRIRYLWLGETLGNVNARAGGPMQLANLDQGSKQIMTVLCEGRDVILLCECADQSRCHRTLVAKLVQDALAGLS